MQPAPEAQILGGQNGEDCVLVEKEKFMAKSTKRQEKRAQPRLAVKGASVCYLLSGPSTRKSGFSDPCPIVDLSTTGMALLADRPEKAGRRVSLLASFSKQKESLLLEGRIVYALAVGVAGHKYRLGIRFQTFAHNKGCNPPQALDDLAQAIKAHAG